MNAALNYDFHALSCEAGYEIKRDDAANGSVPWLEARNTQLNVFMQDLMRELDEKEEAIKSVQDKAERLMLKNHPARLTIEASPLRFSLKNFSVTSVTVIVWSKRFSTFSTFTSLFFFF